MPSTLATGAELVRVRRPGRPTPAQALAALADEPLAFALAGRWAGGGAIVGSDPLRVAAPNGRTADSSRARLLELAPGLGLRPEERPITLDDARSAPALFLTSCLRLAVPASFSPDPQDRPDIDRIRSALANS